MEGHDIWSNYVYCTNYICNIVTTDCDAMTPIAILVMLLIVGLVAWAIIEIL